MAYNYANMNKILGNKIALITDLHFGVRKDDPLFLEKQLVWLEETFFRTLAEYDIKTVINMGDSFDNRISINVKTLQIFKEKFFEKLSALGYEHFCIVGNHDAHYKNDNSYSVVKTMSYLEGFHLVQDNIWNLNDKLFLVPWINANNKESILKQLENIEDKGEVTLLGHFQIEGIPMVGGLCKDGLPMELFREFKKVYSGHFHNPSITKNIIYTGNPFFFTWSDYGQDKGFRIISDAGYTFKHISTPDKVFHVIDHDDLMKGKVELPERPSIIKYMVNNLEDHKDGVEKQMKLMADGGHRVEVIDTAVYTEAHIPLYVKESNETADVASKEFMSEVVQSMDSIKDKDGVTNYLTDLLEKTRI